MMRLAFIIMSLVVWVNGQIYFPDQFDSLMESYAQAKQYGLPYPTYAAADAPGTFASPAVNPIQHDTTAGDTFYPAVAELGSSAPARPAQSQSIDPETEYWSNHVNNILSKGVTKFAIDMDRAIYQSQLRHNVAHGANVIFSPLSIASTLAMVLLGSAGVTFREVSRILGLESGVDISSHSEIVHLMLGLVLKSIDAKADLGGPQITMANGMFIQNGFPIGNEFLGISRAAYNNEIVNLDFIRQPDLAKKTINDWVKLRTNGKIASILDNGIDPETKLIIASALFFNGEWNRYFFPRGTTRTAFAVTPTESVEVDMMYNGGTFPFYQDLNLRAKIVGLPYKGWQNVEGKEAKRIAMMYVIVPGSRDADALKRLENELTADRLEELISKMDNRTCIIGFPRMKISSNLNLNEPLQSLGLVSLFNSKSSNLALVSPVFDNATGVRSRFGIDEEDLKNSTKVSNNNETRNNTGKSHFIRYEDKAGGYSVEQWDSGVYIEKIPTSYHRKRSTKLSAGEKTRARRAVRKEKMVPYDSQKSDESVKFVSLEDNKYRFDQERPKREGRAIDQDFVRFIESRRAFPNYGLDSLRNDPSLGNPGLFVSDVLHKVEMDVTETGTTAAAVTSSTVQRGGDIKRIMADRPFLFFIRHEPSKLILFWGAVNKPTPFY